MQKVTKILDRFTLSSVHEKVFNRAVTSARCIDADKQIANRIFELEKRVCELKELQEFMRTNDQVYFFKDDASGFSYTNKSGEPYGYKEVNDKHILIDKDFNVYEIVEYTSVRDITHQKNYDTEINKIVKVKPLKNIRKQNN